MLVGLAALLVVSVVVFLASRRSRPAARAAESVASRHAPLAGSASCRECHSAFHQKWSTSWHGRTVRPAAAALTEEKIAGRSPLLEVGGASWQAVIGQGEPHLVERVHGSSQERRWPILHAVGGKDVCYFLTARERGFLQVLPLAWDVRRREWFKTAASAVRHAEGLADSELPWTDRAFTFNTACGSCHVSQLSTGYDARDDSYRTVWGEPGISCETCHESATEHVRVFRERRDAAPVADPRIVSVKAMTVEQRNGLCLSCHAKSGAIGPPFEPGNSFFDHFDLVALESREYHADGRDLGENYTATSWLMSACARAGKLDCVHCHTSSGRYRFAAQPDNACLPCHADRVNDAFRHSRHAPDRPGGRCTDCHMPTTEFARMRRSDHSMRPPLPAASLAFGSPNACTSCHEHEGRDARWAARVVKEWRGGQPSRIEQRVLREGALVTAAREGDARRLGDILSYLRDSGHDPVIATSLVRLLGAFADPGKTPVLETLAADPSPLVRAAAVMALAEDPQGARAAAAGLRDPVRLVRLRAAGALAGRRDLPPDAQQQLARATDELEASLQARPDQFEAHFALGILAGARGREDEAAARYRGALALRPGHVESLVNLALSEARLGRLNEAEPPLREALRNDPRSVAAHMNLALLLAETGRPAEAERELRAVLDIDPRQAQAAYNLALLVAERDPREALALARRAVLAAPGEPRYAEAAAALAARADGPSDTRRGGRAGPRTRR